LQQDKHPSNHLTLWSLSGNQGQGWKLAQASVPPGAPGWAWTYNMVLLFQATHGPGIYGDIAIDDISSTTGICEPDSQ
jgi:hypothetical protein